MRGRIGTPQRAMHIYYGTPLYNRAIMKDYIKKIDFSKNEVAKFRLEVINFYNKYGLAATIDAYGVSRATIFRWKKKLKDSKGDISSLIPKSKAPKNKRKMETPPEVIEFISRIRKEHPRLGKEKIKPLLDEYCKKIGVKTISVSTIGKIIKRYNMFYVKTGRYYHNPDSKWAKRKRRHSPKVGRSPREKEPGYIEIDSIIKFVDGIKVYIINAIDVKTRFVFSRAYRSLSSNSALDFFKKLEMVYPYEKGIRVVQTDNGSEFLGLFDKYLNDKGIEHRFIYVRSPKINGYIERFNRSIQE
ncbi:MAG: transposase, partial [Chloroflexi bacterium]|nr:transposase [Chloroflexota bacterium]